MGVRVPADEYDAAQARGEVAKHSSGNPQIVPDRNDLPATAADIIEIGRDLIAVKKALGHGHFLRWIEAEFGMAERTAQRFMNISERLGDKVPTNWSDLSFHTLATLAAPSTPDDVVEEVTARAADGETFTAADIGINRKDIHLSGYALLLLRRLLVSDFRCSKMRHLIICARLPAAGVRSQDLDASVPGARCAARGRSVQQSWTRCLCYRDQHRPR